MNKSDYKTIQDDFGKSFKYLLIIILVIVIGALLFFSILFHHDPLIEPTIDLTDLESIYDSRVLDGSDISIIDGREYEIFCKLKLSKKNDQELSFGKPFAYVHHLDPAYYEYFSPITSLPDGEWIASFKENGSGGVINKKNGLFIWKRVDVSIIPDWMIDAHEKYISGEG